MDVTAEQATFPMNPIAFVNSRRQHRTAHTRSLDREFNFVGVDEYRISSALNYADTLTPEPRIGPLSLMHHLLSPAVYDGHFAAIPVADAYFKQHDEHSFLPHLDIGPAVPEYKKSGFLVSETVLGGVEVVSLHREQVKRIYELIMAPPVLLKAKEFRVEGIPIF